MINVKGAMRITAWRRASTHACTRRQVCMCAVKHVLTAFGLCGCVGLLVADYRWFLGAYVHSAHPASVAMVIPLSPNLNVYLETL